MHYSYMPVDRINSSGHCVSRLDSEQHISRTNPPESREWFVADWTANLFIVGTLYVLPSVIFLIEAFVALIAGVSLVLFKGRNLQ